MNFLYFLDRLGRPFKIADEFLIVEVEVVGDTDASEAEFLCPLDYLREREGGIVGCLGVYVPVGVKHSAYLLMSNYYIIKLWSKEKEFSDVLR